MGAHDNENEVVLPNHVFVNAAAFVDLDDAIYKEQRKNLTEMTTLQKTHPIDEIEGHYLYKGQPVVPEQIDIQQQILR